MTSRDRYHALTVKEVVRETHDSVSLVLDAPDHAYVPGQFVTLRLEIDGEPHLRSYSMSSAPGIDDDLQVTVKRVPDGLVSNWINDNVRPGDTIEVSTPTGVFVLADTDDEVVAFAGGSGITPIFSIIKTALHTTQRNVRLFFANRDKPSTIFAAALNELAAVYPDRFFVHFHYDAVDSFITHGDVRAFVDGHDNADVYICGPGPFMDIVEAALEHHDEARIYIERFVPAAETPQRVETPAAPTDDIQVTVTLRGKTVTIPYRAGNTLLQTARWGGLSAPSSCEAGHCATCMAQVVEGAVNMKHNEVLTDDEVAEGWVLTCQTVPTSPVVKVVYE